MKRGYYKIKPKNEVALKKYLNNADKNSDKRDSRSNRVQRNDTKRNNLY